MSNDGNTDDGLKSMDEILDGAGTEAEHKGNQTQLQVASNELLRNQIHQQQRLEVEISELRSSIDSYRKVSIISSIAIILLSAGLLLVGLIQVGWV